MDSGTDNEFSKAVDRIEEEQEEIDDALEDLLIFPTQNVLRRLVQRLENHFAHEEAFLKQWNVPSRDSDAQVQGQQRIMNLASRCGSVPTKPTPESCSS